MKQLFIFLMVLAFCIPASAQRSNLRKLSPMLRQFSHVSDAKHRMPAARHRDSSFDICAFVQTKGDAREVLASHGCRLLAGVGDISIANIPSDRLNELAADPRVCRIEAERGNQLTMDSTGLHLNALPAYAGQSLPQAYTGKGVVMGIMDIGFDLTHPNFYDSTGTDYRIRCLWDQLSPDTLESTLYVGRDYTTTEELLGIQHSFDGKIHTHGTHTAGTAAGSGFTSPYRGMAFESDLCLVANAVSNNVELVPEDIQYKYTYATDALGFKYIFDYAESVGKPCVISFSEGSMQDFYGYDPLYYAMLDSLVGPGRIIVSSAGNGGHIPSYFHKPSEVDSMGGFLFSYSDHVGGLMKSKDPFTIRTVVYSEHPDTFLIPTERVLAAPDSSYVDTMLVGGVPYVFYVDAYPSCYNPEETVFDFVVWAFLRMGLDRPVSIEVLGDADVSFYKTAGYFRSDNHNPQLNAAECSHSINSPSSAPSVICVGATSYRTSFINYKGETRVYDQGTNGQRGNYSSVGPTFDNRIKPDVMAPGTNIISSYSSFYLENKPDASDISSDVEHFEWNGRTYAWNSNAGTSMSSPVLGGAVALWLQANPQLTPEDVKGIFSRTCRHYDPALTYPNNLYGYGEVDVYRGLLDILQISSVEGISQHQPERLRIVPIGEGRLRLHFDEAPTGTISVRVYSVGGACVAEQHLTGGQTQYEVELAGVGQGVYAVQVNTSSRSTTGSSLIRF
ncbi:MAG: S8 family serine peptidase [Prevotella sp.]|nr:S8 family serine peptidase [Prevotella sp.]